MVWIRKKLVNNFFILLIIVFSCGFYSTKGSLPVHIKSIHVSSILNESPEHSITDRLLDEINNTLIDENILEIKDWNSADSRLNITILRVEDSPNVYGLGSNNEFNEVDEWKVVLTCSVDWVDVFNGKSLFKTNINTSAIYGTESDINIDGIDNDGDNLIDGNDSDEFGPPREGAIRIAIEKISREILNQITSTW
tara:strand:+ start:2903 stop:3487 length:585 start_codon:yes stop_codon:yes gene_type:complete